MSALIERLRLLHRRGEGGTAEGRGGAESVPPRTFSLPEFPVPVERPNIYPDLSLAPVERDGHSCLAGRLRLSAQTQHGQIRVGDVLRLTGRAAALLSGDPRLEGFDVTRAAFFDLETTGLMGGSGNLAFLAGLIRVEADGAIVLHQILIRHPAEEPAALALLEEHLAGVDFLVSFNGKSFDRNVLADRFVMNRRSPRRVLALPHLDLLHPARRLYRGALGACNLAAIESSCLGLHRPATEVRGADVPGRWFDFLHTERFELLAPVVDHNLLDILSLVTLGAHLADCVCSPDSAGAAPAVQVAVARLLLARGAADEGERLLRRLTLGDVEDPIVYAALGLLAEHLRTTARFGEANTLWGRMIAAGGIADLSPWLGSAIALEHRLSRPGEALALVERLLDRLPLEGVLALKREQLIQRRARLVRKAARLRCGRAPAPDPERVCSAG